MSLTIELPAEAEARLAFKAKQAGVDPSTYVQRMIAADVSIPAIEDILRPVHESFEQSGMTEEQLGELLLGAKKQMRMDRRLREAK